MGHRNLPRHVAIIMDGNGRWAEARRRPRTYGHLRGALVAKKTITHAATIGIPFLTLFTFSSENWYRPPEEVNFLMRLLARQILREQQTLMKHNIQFRTLGRLQRLPDTVRRIVEDTIRLTEGNTGMTLVFALSYGGRQEIVDAAKIIAEQIAQGQISASELDEKMFCSQMESSFLPDPDLIIRTSGEHRLSNFLLWQSAYSELLILDKMWPDFKDTDFDSALNAYSERNRRFGKILKTDIFAESSK